MAGQLGSYRFWGEFEDDDITRLPQDYEAKITDDNRVYFIKYTVIHSPYKAYYCYI